MLKKDVTGNVIWVPPRRGEEKGALNRAAEGDAVM